MSNPLNKNKNKLKENDEICTTQRNLILTLQTKRRRFQKIANGHGSTEELLEETRQRVELVEEAREEFLNLYSPREENPDERELTRTARSAEGARAWSELFVRDMLPKRTNSFDEEPSSPKSIAAKIQRVGAGVQSVGVRIKSVGVGV